MKTKDIKKANIHSEVLKGEEKILLQNKHSKMVAGLSKRHLNKIISTVFTRDVESRHTYLKKELILRKFRLMNLPFTIYTLRLNKTKNHLIVPLRLLQVTL